MMFVLMVIIGKFYSKDPESGFGHDKAKSIKEYLTSHGYEGDADTPRPTFIL